MAPSISTARTLVSLAAHNLTFALTRRGYAAASQAAAAQLRRESGRMGKTVEEEKSWVPDPVTGYYRPANLVDDIDVADLRDIFLKQKKIAPQ